MQESWECEDCNVVLDGIEAFTEHMIVHIIEEKKASMASNGVESESDIGEALKDAGETVHDAIGEVLPVKHKVKRKKKVSEKRLGKSKKSKTLRESEMEVNEAFSEKMIVKDDGSFHCKECPLFVTKVRLLARSHAQACGKKSKLGRRSKKHVCPECGKAFLGKLKLREHNQMCHVLPKYQCSICMKQFGLRGNYKKHLKIHDQLVSFCCPYCPKTFTFEAYKNRHVKRVHVRKLEDSEADIGEDNVQTVSELETRQIGDMDELLLEINQKEVECNGGRLLWEFGVSFSNTVKTSTSSYESFVNSLGVNSTEEWDDWILFSKLMDMSVRADGSDEGFEFAVTKHGDGAESVVFVGNTVSSAEAFIYDIISNVVASAVSLSTLGYVQSEGGDGDKEAIEDSVGKTLEKPRSFLLPQCLTEKQHEMLDQIDKEMFDKTEAEVSMRQLGKVKKSKEDLRCEYCNTTGFRNQWFLDRHVSLMHVGSIRCKICETVFVDKFSYMQHSKTCYYWCGKEGCGYHEKRKSRVDSHRRQHEKEF